MSEHKATWGVELNAECPNCKEEAVLLDYVVFWDGRQLDIAEHDTEISTDVEVICPVCRHEFIVDLEY